MNKNMGTIDRTIRVLIALIMAALIISGQLGGTVAIIAGILAGVFLLTSVISFCPLYWPLKFSTRK
ncbi:MAG TPA: DUF2892 domain-containing protein [Pseudomonadales bacterium]